ncbi:MAG: hypothetical protein HQ559_16450 [Lentisphaerae bacterium]|nr:hypothetical protein [Lentisphaerota bacterium]
MAEQTEVGQEATVRKAAVFFELEYVAVPGRRIMFDVLKSVLADKGAEITPILFSRHCLHAPIATSLTELLKAVGKTRLSAKKLASDIAEGIRLSLADGGTKLNPGLARLLAAANERGMSAGALSGLNSSAATEMSGNLGLLDLGVIVLSDCVEDRVFPTRDSWLKLAGETKTGPLNCLAVASSAVGCRSAVSAGMKCVAVPDQYTEFQDFGGADHVTAELDDETITVALDAVEPF